MGISANDGLKGEEGVGIDGTKGEVGEKGEFIFQ